MPVLWLLFKQNARHEKEGGCGLRGADIDGTGSDIPCYAEALGPIESEDLSYGPAGVSEASGNHEDHIIYRTFLTPNKGYLSNF